MAFPNMLATAAEQAGMKVPSGKGVNLDDYGTWDKEAYPHFFIYCQLQLGRAIRLGEHWENAKIIATIPEEKLKLMTIDEFRELGVYPQ